MKRFYILVAFLIISCEDNNTSTINQELTFISSEGNFGSSNASISGNGAGSAHLWLASKLWSG